MLDDLKCAFWMRVNSFRKLHTALASIRLVCKLLIRRGTHICSEPSGIDGIYPSTKKASSSMIGIAKRSSCKFSLRIVDRSLSIMSSIASRCSAFLLLRHCTSAKREARINPSAPATADVARPWYRGRRSQSIAWSSSNWTK